MNNKSIIKTVIFTFLIIILLMWALASTLGIGHTFSGKEVLYYDIEKKTLEKKKIFNLSRKPFYAFVEGKKIEKKNPSPFGVRLKKVEKLPVRIYYKDLRTEVDEEFEESIKLIIKFASEAADKLHLDFKPDPKNIKFINGKDFNDKVFAEQMSMRSTTKASFNSIVDKSCNNCIHIVNSSHPKSELSSFYQNFDDRHFIFLNDGNRTNPKVVMHEIGHFAIDTLLKENEGHIEGKDSLKYPDFPHHLMSVIDGPFNYFISPSTLLKKHIENEEISTEFHFPFDFKELENPFRCEMNFENITDNCLNKIIDYYGVDSMQFNALQEQNATLYNNIRNRSIPDEGSYKLAIGFNSQPIKTGGFLSWFFNNNATYDPYNIKNNERYSLADFKWMIVRLAPNLTDDEHNELARLHFESFYKRRVRKLNLWKIKIELEKPEPIIDPNGVQLEGDELVDFVIENTELIDLVVQISAETDTINSDSPDKQEEIVFNVISDTLKIADLPVLEKEEKKREIKKRLEFKK